ncbi:MAG: YfjI family protein [Candidatus Sedimenticola sp. (ex Thyasira tokunagai)]
MSANVERVLAEIDRVPIPAEPRSDPVIEWGEPGRIEAKLTPVPTLPEELIPGPFRQWIVDIAHRMQTPPDFAVITAMTVTASVVGAGCAIRPKRRDNWEVVPNLWGACIGRPSVVLKSPSMKEPIDMLSLLQAEAREVYKEERKAYQFDQHVKEAQRKQLEKDIQKVATAKVKDTAKLDALKNDYLNEDDEEEPIPRLFKTNETSIQSQTVLQVQNPRGLLTFRDELTGLLTRWDKREYEDERAYFLEGFNGDGSYTDYKIGRGLTDAENICISLFGGIQPDKLRRYLHQSMTGGNDGLMQRFQLAVYPDEPKSWRLIDEYPNAIEKDRAYEIIRALADADFMQWGVQQDEHEKRPYMRFTDEGQKVFNEWLTDLQTDKLPNEENPLIAEHLGKYRSLMPSLALIIHLVSVADNSADGQVSERAAMLAAAWCEYLEAHARRIYGMVTEPGRQAAAILADRIRAGKLANPFTAKDVYRNHWSGLNDRGVVDAACMVLIDEDWLFVERSKSTGGRPPLPKFWINPAVGGGNE